MLSHIVMLWTGATEKELCEVLTGAIYGQLKSEADLQAGQSSQKIKETRHTGEFSWTVECK